VRKEPKAEVSIEGLKIPELTDSNSVKDSFGKGSQVPIMIFMLLAVVLGIIGIYYVFYEYKLLKTNALDDLSSIADLKVKQIELWNLERMEDAKQFYETPMIQMDSYLFLADQSSPRNNATLNQYMLSYQKQNDYSWIGLLDINGKVVKSYPGEVDTLSILHNQFLKTALDSDKIVRADIHLDTDNLIEGKPQIKMSYWVPVKNPNLASSKPIGAWVLQIDPQRYLFPLVQSWPTSSKSAETILVRREGNDVLYMNELRHKQDTAMKLRLKISDHAILPSARALMGEDNISEGKSYQGIKVIAASRNVKGTSWYMIAQVDKSELFSPLKRRIWLTVFAALMLIVGTALVIALLERRNNTEWLRRQLLLEKDKTKLQDDYQKIAREWRTTFDSISDVIWLLDADSKVIRTNESATKMWGLTYNEIIGKHCWELVHDANQPINDCPYQILKASKGRATADIQIGDKWIMVTVYPILDEADVLLGAVHIMRDITDKVVAERAIKESENRFRSIFDQSPLGICLVGFDKKFVKVNRAFTKLTGYSEEELQQLTFSDITHPEHVEQDVDQINRLITGTIDNYTAEKRYIRKDGSYVWGRISVSLVRNAAGHPIYLLPTIEDISESKAADHAIKTSEEKFRSVFEDSIIGMSLTLPNGSVKPNQAFCDMLGYTPDEIEMNWKDITYPEDVAITAGLVKDILSGKRDSFRVTKRYLHKNGNIVWADVSTVLLRDKDNVPLFFVTSTLDITKRINDETEMLEMGDLRRQANEALKASEYRFRELFENMSNGVSVYEPTEDGKDFIIRDINHAGEVITKANHDEIIGRKVTEVFPDINEQGLLDVFIETNLTGIPKRCDTYSYENNVLKYWLDNYVLKLDSGELIALYNDVTEMKRADEALKKVNEELEQRVVERTKDLEAANKELEAFSYSVSHDLRSPLRGILGWSQALNEDYRDKLDGQANQYLDRIIHETQRMGHLIEALLKLSQISKQEIRPELVDLSAVAATIIERLREENPNRLVETLVQTHLTTQGDSKLLEIVLTNLINNAWKFTSKQASAKIEFGKTIRDGKHIFFVSDNGAGFDMSFATNLFGAFQRMHKETDFPGTGVGLATVQRIIKRHGGNIWVETKPGCGATFYFTLKEEG